MTAYSLNNAVTALWRMMPWGSVSVTGEPLTGLVNGSNTTFFVARPPVSGTVLVYDSSGSPITVSAQDADSGRVVLASAPVAPCTATYTHRMYTDTAMLGYAEEGFRYMETLLHRGYYLVNSGGVYYVSSDASVVVDPVIGSTTFSASVLQTRFLDLCAWYVFVRSQQAESAANAIQVREERMGGLLMDRSRQWPAWEALAEKAQAELEQAMHRAAEEAGLVGAVFEGGIEPGARSDYYTATLDWWRESRQARGL